MNVRVSFYIPTDNYGCKSLNQIKKGDKNQLSMNVRVSFKNKQTYTDTYGFKSINQALE